KPFAQDRSLAAPMSEQSMGMAIGNPGSARGPACGACGDGFFRINRSFHQPRTRGRVRSQGLTYAIAIFAAGLPGELPQFLNPGRLENRGAMADNERRNSAARRT